MGEVDGARKRKKETNTKKKKKSLRLDLVRNKTDFHCKFEMS